VLVTLLGDHLWSSDVNISVGEDLIVENWNQGIEGACPGESRQIIIGPNMNLERIWNLSTSSQIPKQESIEFFKNIFTITDEMQATVVVDVVIAKVRQDNILHHLFNLLRIEALSKEHTLAELLKSED
jgi:hypothetical protein